jgi:hypothetical protein
MSVCTTRARRAAPVPAVLGAAVAAYRWVIRPAHLTWGATPDEAAAPMAGDELVPAPTLVSTRAVTIEGAPDDAWPWLVQMGQGRAGFYTYDWLENLFRLDIHSADRIVPELQQLDRGDVVPLAPSGRGVRVEVVEAGRALVLAHPDGGWSWAFVLEPDRAGRTRLVVRNRWTTSAAPVGQRLALALVEPAAFVMERGMLLGIKARAERGGSLPGDEVVPDATTESTHAIAIRASPESVWPWLVQMGRWRAGWYSFDRLDNGGVPSATRIVPELQALGPGDLVPTGPGRADGYRVERIERDRALVLTSDAGPDLHVSWAFVLKRAPSGATLLLTRLRVGGRLRRGQALSGFAKLHMLHPLFTRRQLRGIRARAERRS